MFHRYVVPAFILIALACPLQAQRKGFRPPPPDLPAPVQTNSAFRALFKPVVEKAARSTVRVQLDEEDAALGTVVSKDGYVLTKASEIEDGAVSINTIDGRHFDAKVVSVSEDFDLALLKVDGTGLTPIDWTSSKEALVGNWVAAPNANAEPVAVGVVSTSTWVPRSGFLGITFKQGVTKAQVGEVSPGGAAEKAGLKPNDIVVRIDKINIPTFGSLIETLQQYQRDDTVTIIVEREGKRVELKATLGRRPPDPRTPKGKKSRGDIQNQWGSTLSDRKTAIPCILQTDAVIRPSDCGGPLVDLEGRAIGLTICRAGRTESWALPTDAVSHMTKIMLTARPGITPKQRVMEARAALAAARKDEQCVDVIAEAKRYLADAMVEEKWWQGRKIEKGPAPEVLDAERAPKPRVVTK